MAGFKLVFSDVGSDRSANYATTTNGHFKPTNYLVHGDVTDASFPDKFSTCRDVTI